MQDQGGLDRDAEVLVLIFIGNCGNFIGLMSGKLRNDLAIQCVNFIGNCMNNACSALSFNFGVNLIDICCNWILEY